MSIFFFLNYPPFVIPTQYTFLEFRSVPFQMKKLTHPLHLKIISSSQSYPLQPHQKLFPPQTLLCHQDTSYLLVVRFVVQRYSPRGNLLAI